MDSSNLQNELFDRRRQVLAVAEDCLRRRSAGEDLSDAEVAGAHPELMPELREELAALAMIARAKQRSRGIGGSSDRGISDETVVARDLASRSPSGYELNDRLANAQDGRGPRLAGGTRGSSAPAPIRSPMNLTPWSVAAGAIPGYEIIREIHRGGQGVVYEALQKATGRHVAMKVMREGPFAGRDDRLRFAREVQVLARLNHPNVVAILDSGTADGRHYFVMDYVEGKPLDQWATDVGKVEKSKSRKVETRGEALLQPPVERRATGEAKRSAGVADKAASREFLPLFAIICDAVHAAHLRGIIHRDIKPSNIRVDNDGRPHVLDFGLAKLTGPMGEEAGAESAMTITGQFVGSLPWSSPEQVEGKPDQIDIRTDVYSLGVVLYQMLTGRFPYSVTGTIREVADRILQTDPARPSTIREWIDDELETIVIRCIDKDRERRYQSAGALAADVRAYLAGEPIEAKRDSTWYMFRKTVRRHRGAATTALAFVLVIAAGLITSLVSWRQTLVERDRAQKRFNQVRNLSHAVLFDLYDIVAPLPGSTKPRQEFVKTGLQYLDDLGKEAGGDVALQREIAKGYDRVGDLQGSQHTAFGHLGDPQGALDSYQKALRIRESLSASSGEDVKFGRELYGSHESIGNIYVDQGKLQQALEEYEKARGIIEGLPVRVPDDAKVKASVAVIHERIGNVRRALHQWDDALAGYRKALQIREELVAADPTDVYTRRAISVSHEKIGIVLQSTSQPAEALAEYRLALDVREKLALEDAAASQTQRDLMVSYGKVADILLGQNNLDEAGELHERALAISEKLAAVDPENVQARRDLAVCCEKVGDVLVRKGQAADALRQYRRRSEISEDLLRSDPVSASSHMGIVISDYKLGEGYEALAGQAGMTVDEQMAAWNSSREAFQRCYDKVVEMLDKGLAPEADRGELQQIKSSVTRCEEAIARIRGENAPASSPAEPGENP